jgi:hypothetical protein
MSKGATPQEWATFDMVLGLTEDLLPVVSDPAVKISPNSKMQAVGKTPSIINKQGFAAGLPGWTDHVATDKDIARWSADSRLGACLQTKTASAFDADVDDEGEALAIAGVIGRYFQGPKRTRPNSAKFLQLVYIEGGPYTKRSFKTKHGMVEFLATGQQCIVAGTHTSGVRYEWTEKLTSLPTITAAQFEALWADLVAKFAIEKPTTPTTTKKETLNVALDSDPLAQHLLSNNWVYSRERDGRLNIRCPNEHEHSGPSSESATVYYPANTGGYARGHFDCKHAHCQHLTDEDFGRGVGYDDITFDDVREEAAAEHAAGVEVSNTDVYQSYTLGNFQGRVSQGYHIKHVLPVADMIMVFGASGAGKSFVVFDMAMAVALGTPWRDHRVTQGNVSYVIAEGAGGFNARIKAYTEYHGIDAEGVPFQVIPAQPNFLKTPDIKKLIRTIVTTSPRLVIIDTWAQVTAGGNENSGEDMGLALANCRRINKETGATVLLIHHSGKDADRGARGWSGLRGAADAELEVVRSGDDRVVSITKLKDGVEGVEFGFKLDIRVVGTDPDGDDITSCVVLPSEVSRAQVGMGKNERIIYEAARDSKGLDDAAPDVETLLNTAINQLPYDPEIDKRDRRRDLVTRAYKKCIERGYLVEVEGRVECS